MLLSLSLQCDIHSTMKKGGGNMGKGYALLRALALYFFSSFLVSPFKTHRGEMAHSMRRKHRWLKRVETKSIVKPLLWFSCRKIGWKPLWRKRASIGRSPLPFRCQQQKESSVKLLLNGKRRSALAILIPQ